MSALYGTMCVCVYLLDTTYKKAHLLLICCCKRPRASSAENSIIHHDPISWPFDSAAHSGWQVRLITAVKTPYLPDGKIDLEAHRDRFLCSATRPKLEIRNWPQAHHKRCRSILCEGFSQLFCIKMSTPNWSILVDIEKKQRNDHRRVDTLLLKRWRPTKSYWSIKSPMGLMPQRSWSQWWWLSPDSMVETCWNMWKTSERTHLIIKTNHADTTALMAIWDHTMLSMLKGSFLNVTCARWC